MKLDVWRKGSAASDIARPGEEPTTLLATAVSHRTFLKMLAAAASGAGLGQLARGGARPAEAVYTPGSPSDIIDTNLTVQGNLIVSTPGRVGIGTTNPQGKLDVAGGICVNGTEVIGGDAAVKRAYYAP